LLHACTQTEEVVVEEAEAVEEEVQGAAERLLFSGSFPIPADPVRLAERIRRNRSQLSAAFDDTEYEPYGLPEVVMKGRWRVEVSLNKTSAGLRLTSCLSPCVVDSAVGV
jgi:hypothetical protein